MRRTRLLMTQRQRGHWRQAWWHHGLVDHWLFSCHLVLITVGLGRHRRAKVTDRSFLDTHHHLSWSQIQQRNETNKQAKSPAMGRNWWSLRAELRLRNARVANDSVWDWQTIPSDLQTIPSGKHFSERPLRLSNTVGLLLLLCRQFFKTQSERKTEPNISRSMTWLHEYWICQESIRLIVEHIPKSSTIPKTFLEAWIDDKITGANFK